MDTLFTAPGIDGYLCETCVDPMVNAEEVMDDIRGVVTCAICKAAMVPSWDSLDSETQDDLREWYNSRVIDAEDKALLAQLVADGNFRAYSCEHCGSRVLQGTPDNWGDFQGVRDMEGIGGLCGECVALCDTLCELRGY